MIAELGHFALILALCVAVVVGGSAARAVEHEATARLITSAIAVDLFMEYSLWRSTRMEQRRPAPESCLRRFFRQG